ncbi:MAG: hypothetical protein J6K55_04240 [Clostridia bacterium]|nr:hypothetical protein [Clostridia bacterium]
MRSKVVYRFVRFQRQFSLLFERQHHICIPDAAAQRPCVMAASFYAHGGTEE